MAQLPGVHYRAGFVQAFLVIGTGVLFDTIGLFFMLTGVGEVVTEALGFVGAILFPAWFTLLGAELMGKNAAQKFGTMGAGSVIELVPFLNGISPTFTIETAVMVYLMRKEDRKKAEERARMTAQVSADTVRNQAYTDALARKEIQLQIAASEEAANDNEEEQTRAAA